MIPCLWSTTQNGRFKIISLSADTLEPALSLMKSIFFKNENISNVFGVQNNIKSINELTNLALDAAEDGISLVAQDSQNGKIVSALFNKILWRNKKTVFEKHLDRCKEESSKGFLQFIINADSNCNFFDYYDHSCGVELLFMVTDPKYSRQHIGSNLYQSSFKMAKLLAKRLNVKTPISDKKISLEDFPKFLVSCSTINRTEKMADRMGLQVFHEISYNNCYYKGQTFANIIGDTSGCYTISSTKL